MNDDLIQLPANASHADFARFVNPGEVYDFIAATKSGAHHIVGRPGQYEVGQPVVQFEQVTTGGRRTYVHVGWRKRIVGKITGTGKQYSDAMGNNTRVNYYIEYIGG